MQRMQQRLGSLRADLDFLVPRRKQDLVLLKTRIKIGLATPVEFCG
jgi:hypothetical protein